jgi:hypothetical protein
MTSGTHGTAREDARARVRSAPTGRPHWAASERERGECAGTGWHRQVGTTCQREAGARGGGGGGWGGGGGLKWAELGCSG